MKQRSTNVLIDADKKIPSHPKKKQEPIHYIEVPPIGHWFQQAFDHQGKPIWFLRLQVTGLRNRRYGPFASQRKALVFLDWLLDQFGDVLLEARNEIASFRSRNPPSRIEMITIPSSRMSYARRAQWNAN